MDDSRITNLTQLVQTTLDRYGETLAEVRKGLDETTKELQSLRLDVVRLQEQGYERRLEALGKKVSDVCSGVRELNNEVEHIKLEAAKVEGMTTAAKLAWGAIVSAPGFVALLMKMLAP